MGTNNINTIDLIKLQFNISPYQLTMDDSFNDIDLATYEILKDLSKNDSIFRQHTFDIRASNLYKEIDLLLYNLRLEIHNKYEI